MCRAAGVPLLINDRVDVALAIGADGVHVGQSDLPAHVVRAMIGGCCVGGGLETVGANVDAAVAVGAVTLITVWFYMFGQQLCSYFRPVRNRDARPISQGRATWGNGEKR